MEQSHSTELALRPPLHTIRSQSGDTSITSQSTPPISFLYRMYVACDVLQLSTETRFTAMVLLHRYAHAILNTHVKGTVNEGNAGNTSSDPSLSLDDWPWVGGACLFLACKTEEEPRRLRDIINMIHMVLLATPSQDTCDGKAAPSIDAGKSKQPQVKQATILHMTATPPMLDDQYWEAKQKVIETEQAVLRWLGFDCFVSHPHRAVYYLVLAECNEQIMRKRLLLPSVYRYLNNTLFYSRALTFPVMPLACAAIQFAMEEENKASDNGTKGDDKTTALNDGWWREYGVSDSSLKDCRDCMEQAKVFLDSESS